MVELMNDTEKRADVSPQPDKPQQRLTKEPSVSVVIPCFNEERFIGKVLDNLAQQYEAERFEILIVDGMSQDHTRDVVSQFAAAHPNLNLRIVDNPKRNIPTALNLGVRNASGDIIVRMDAHSVPSKNYVRRCVQLLNEADVDVVGMPWRIQPGADTLIARAIARAVSHPFGIGDAKYRLASSTGTSFVDTVPFGVFRKTLWEKLNGFNEELLANEDYDFNYRVRVNGGKVMLDGSGHCNYFARPTLTALASQYVRYGKWKAQMVKLHPRSIKLRHVVAPVFVLAMALTAFGAWFWKPAAWSFFTLMLTYSVFAFVCATSLAKRARDYKLTLVIPLVFFVLHVSWGSSFLLGLVYHRR